MCGIPAMMPSYVRVSRYGLIAFASSLDRIGPLTRTVRDAAKVMRIIAGRDPNDSTSAGTPVSDYLSEMAKPVKGLRIGIPKEYFGPGMDDEVRAKIESGIALLKKLGCQPMEIRMPHTDYAIATYYIIATAEASSNLARYDGVRYGPRVPGETLIEMYRKTRGRGFGPEVKRRIMLGTYVLSAGYYDAYYLKGQKVRSLIAQDFRDAFTKVDAIVTPTSPVPAFKLGERTEDARRLAGGHANTRAGLRRGGRTTIGASVRRRRRIHALRSLHEQAGPHPGTDEPVARKPFCCYRRYFSQDLAVSSASRGLVGCGGHRTPDHGRKRSD